MRAHHYASWLLNEKNCPAGKASDGSKASACTAVGGKASIMMRFVLTVQFTETVIASAKIFYSLYR
jgi:hypothetical protein